MSSTEVATLPAGAASERSETPPKRSPRRRRSLADRVAVPVSRGVIFVGLIIAWWALVEFEVMPPLYSASPLETWNRFLELITESAFWNSARVTMIETIGGWSIGATGGLVTGMILGRWERLGQIFDPFVTFANATPKIALAPFFILWFGIGPESKVALSAIIVFFIVMVPTQSAVSSVDRDLHLVATTMAMTELQRFTKVVAPGIVAPIFGALRLGAVYALLAVVMGEFIAARDGLGADLISATNTFDMPTAFVYLLVLASLAVLINLVLGKVEAHLTRWRRQSSAGSVSV